MAFAPSLLLLGVPSSAIMRSSMRDCSPALLARNSLYTSVEVGLGFAPQRAGVPQSACKAPHSNTNTSRVKPYESSSSTQSGSKLPHSKVLLPSPRFTLHTSPLRKQDPNAE